MAETHPTIAQPPRPAEKFLDVGFRRLTLVFAWVTILLVFLIIWQIGRTAAPAIQTHGVGFLTGSKWDPNKYEFGIAPQIGGTLYSSILGVFLGSVFGVAVAIFLSQDFIPPFWELTLKNIIELLAAIPSVVYGLWGIFVVIPALRPVAGWLHDTLPGVPFFSTRLIGPGMLPAALVLAIMVLPTVAAISRDAIVAVPHKLREAAYGLGATKWEVILRVVIPTASRGIFGAIILAFGRAVGETMALAMLLGNSNTFSWSVFAPGNTLAALLANQWPESSHVEKEALMYAGLVLLAITLLINVLGTLVIARMNRSGGPVK
jgi:phosphate transport system permease protein